MRVEVRIKGDASVAAIPAPALVTTGLQVIQSREQWLNGCTRLVEAASKNLESMLAEMTTKNCHPVLLEGGKLGAEKW